MSVWVRSQSWKFTRWDEKFFRIALEIETWSKHPHTKVGCVLVDNDNIQLAGGYNGLPRGINDNRIEKQTTLPGTNSVTVHAEANAIAAAARKGHSVLGATAYVTRPVCCQCAALLIQAGIQRVLCLHLFAGVYSFDPYGDWAENLIVAEKLLNDADVDYYITSKHLLPKLITGMGTI